MKGLLLKEIYSLKKFRSSLILFFVLWVINFMRRDNYLLAMLVLPYMYSFMATVGIEEDVKSKWNKYALTMPVNIKDLVLTKYIFAYGLMISSFAISIVITYLYHGLLFEPKMFLYILMGLNTVILFIGLYLSLVFKYNSTNGIIILFLIIGIIGGGIFAVYKFLPTVRDGALKILSNIMSSNMTLLYIITIGIGIFIMLISFFVSYKIMKNKEY